MTLSDPQFPLRPPGAEPRCHALVACAGTGSRAGLEHPKQYQVLAGQRLIDHTVGALLQVRRLDTVAVVVAPQDRVYSSPNARVRVLPVGGASRAESVFNGLQALRHAGARDEDWVLVHDAARCLVTARQIDALIDACRDDAVGGLLALPLPDTLKVARPAGPPRRVGRQEVSATVDRSDKWLAQTPQMFRLAALHQALAQAQAGGFAGITDEASAIEATGRQPLLVTGSAQNFKVTFPEDFALAEALLRSRQSPARVETGQNPCP